MTLFRNKYRVESARLPGWDYSAPGYYFVTMCTHDRGCLFGEIIDDTMGLNEYGEIVRDEWLNSFEIRSELIQDKFVVMPNHFHGIVRIVETHGRASRLENGDGCPETHGRASLQSEKQQKNGITHRVPKSISSCIAGFKSTATKRINILRKTPRASLWQPRFYDHIVRNDQELFAIRQYIFNNPINWENDRNVLEAQESKPGKQPWFVYMY
ncbi:MAG: hypothetical protein PHC61_01355 [Chitinivibrionales bacterium]|nr:hypothetical protein [Chitinivibrionales bacterium]